MQPSLRGNKVALLKATNQQIITPLADAVSSLRRDCQRGTSGVECFVNSQRSVTISDKFSDYNIKRIWR